MASEILDSSEPAQPGSGSGRAAEDKAAKAENESVEPVSPLRSLPGRLRNDAQYRRRAARLVIVGIALVAAGAIAADARRAHAQAATAASRLAVDLRVDALPQIEDPTSGTQAPRGDSSLDVKLHNLGPQAVQLTGVHYTFGTSNPRTGTLLTTDVTIRPNQQMDRAFHVTLPCGSTAQTVVPQHPVRLTARIRTSDGRTHSVPVDLSALGSQGGLFDSCAVYGQQDDLNADSQLDDGAVQVSLDLPTAEQAGSSTVLVGVSRAGVPAQVDFVTSPHLPARVTAGTRFTATIRPVVHGCPPGLDLSALPAVGLLFGTDGETYADPYLPLLVAQAVGRACASAGH
jgi:hypothetical protein